MLSKTVPKEALRELMAQHELTGYDVAKILGLQPNTVYCYMAGVRKVRQFHLDQIKKAVGVGNHETRRLRQVRSLQRKRLSAQ
jgi:hypothetical protein